MEGYARKDVVKEINEELVEFIKGEQFLIMETDMKNLKKEMARLTSKDEMTTRINMLFSNLSDKI